MAKMISEAAVASLTGLSRERLRDVRESLERGVHWRHGHDGSVEYTKDGVEVVMERIREVVRFGDVEKKAEAVEAVTVKRDLVMLFPCPNRSWVKAMTLPPDRKVVRVRVADSLYLRVQQTLKDCTPNADGTWTYGGRCR